MNEDIHGRPNKLRKLRESIVSVEAALLRLEISGTWVNEDLLGDQYPPATAVVKPLVPLACLVQWALLLLPQEDIDLPISLRSLKYR